MQIRTIDFNASNRASGRRATSKCWLRTSIISSESMGYRNFFSCMNLLACLGMIGLCFEVRRFTTRQQYCPYDQALVRPVFFSILSASDGPVLPVSLPSIIGELPAHTMRKKTKVGYSIMTSWYGTVENHIMTWIIDDSRDECWVKELVTTDQYCPFAADARW